MKIDKKDVMALVMAYFGLVILTILSIISVSASWSMPKEQTCDLLNLTTMTDCDIFWCELIDCSYDVEKQACICGGMIAEINDTNFYNKTYIDAKLQEIRIDINKTDDKIGNLTSNSSDYEKLDQKIFDLREGIYEDIDELEKDVRDLKYGSSGTNFLQGLSWGNVLNILIFIAVIGIIIYLIVKRTVVEPLRERQVDAKTAHKGTISKQIEGKLQQIQAYPQQPQYQQPPPNYEQQYQQQVQPPPPAPSPPSRELTQQERRDLIEAQPEIKELRERIDKMEKEHKKKLEKEHKKKKKKEED